jgi:hypothetical protein
MHDEADTPIAPEYQETGYPLPPYRELFRLDAWLSNVYEHEGLRIGDPPPQFLALFHAVGTFVSLAMAEEGKSYLEMLEAIHAGEFDGVRHD